MTTIPYPANDNLIKAAQSGNCDELMLAFRNNANINYSRNGTALYWAARKNHFECAKLLIENGAHLESPDNIGRTPTRVAAWAGSTDVLRLLLEHGANIEGQGGLINTLLHTPKAINDSETPLTRAADNGSLDCIFLLLEKGALINAIGIDGNTALCYAAKQGFNVIVRLLLSRGADRNLKTFQRGETAMEIAKRLKNYSVVKVFEDS